MVAPEAAASNFRGQVLLAVLAVAVGPPVMDSVKGTLSSLASSDAVRDPFLLAVMLPCATLSVCQGPTFSMVPLSLLKVK